VSWGLAGGVTLTRPDLQASSGAALKAAEREPLLSERSSKQTQLDQLLWNEPPKCTGCQIQAPEPQQEFAPTSSQATKPTQEIEAYATSTQWLAWQSAVASLRAQITTLNGRIQAVDAKVYRQPEHRAQWLAPAAAAHLRQEQGHARA
jgi:hypothetical protein